MIKEKKVIEKVEIRVKGGRGYLHTYYKSDELPYAFEGCTSLGNNPDFIKRMRDQYNCEVILLD